MDRGVLSTKTIGTTASALIGANPARRALIVSVNDDDEITVSDQPGVVFGEGITFSPSIAFRTLTVENSGDWVQRSLYAVSNSGDVSVSVVEVICPCQSPPLPR